VLVLLHATNVHAEYKDHTREISLVSNGIAGMCTRGVRVAKFPPEVQDKAPRAVLAPYGIVKAIQGDMWSKTEE
jgi:hypothetical protein